MSKVMYGQAGYLGCSMSLGAVTAYDLGEKPLSKWSKTAILEAVDKLFAGDEDHDRVMRVLSKATLKNLRRECLAWSSWHHTGKYARATDFYEIVGEAVILAFVEEIEGGSRDARGNEILEN